MSMCVLVLDYVHAFFSSFMHVWSVYVLMHVIFIKLNIWEREVSAEKKKIPLSLVLVTVIWKDVGHE